MRRLTKRPMHSTSLRWPREEAEVVWAAAKLRGISQSQLVREALRAYVQRVLTDAADRPVAR